MVLIIFSSDYFISIVFVELYLLVNLLFYAINYFICSLVILYFLFFSLLVVPYLLFFYYSSGQLQVIQMNIHIMDSQIINYFDYYLVMINFKLIKLFQIYMVNSFIHLFFILIVINEFSLIIYKIIYYYYFVIVWIILYYY